jgi:hypothetical protein
MIKNKDPHGKTPLPEGKSFPSNMPRPSRMRGLQLVDSWRSRPGEPFAGLPKCVEGAGQKEVSCAGLRGPARAARAALGGVSRMGFDYPLPGEGVVEQEPFPNNRVNSARLRY